MKLQTLFVTSGRAAAGAVGQDCPACISFRKLNSNLSDSNRQNTNQTQPSAGASRCDITLKYPTFSTPFTVPETFQELSPALTLQSTLGIIMSSTIFLTFDAGLLRAILRAYFTLAVLLINFLWTRCLSYRSRHCISSQKQIPLTEMTGWLSGLTLLYAIKSFDSKFAGRYLFGTSMFLCSLFNLISDLAVSGFVQNVTIAGRCNFNTGLVFQYI